jgi:hypothetical protein
MSSEIVFPTLFSPEVSGFLGFQVSGNLETVENHQKPGNYFDKVLM